MGTVQRNRHTAQAGNLKLLYGDTSCNGQIQLRQYEMELTKRGYKVHIQENDKGKVYGYSIKRVTQIINHLCWVSGETLPLQK